MPLIFETVSCELCGSDRQEAVVTGHDHLTGMPGTFQFVRCLDCSLIRQNPRLVPSSLSEYYPDDYPSFTRSIRLEKNPILQLDRRYGQWKRAQLVRQYCGGGSLLDVGCATGNFVFELGKDDDWMAVGLEPNSHACSYARHVLGVQVVCGTLGDTALADGVFDVVTMWNVLEHIYHPLHDLGQAFRVLRPGGWLIFSVPVVSGWLGRWFGADWAEWDLPRHLYVFSPDTVKVLLQKAGFRLVAIKAPFSEYRVFQMSLTNWARRHILAVWSSRAFVSVMRSLPVRAMLSLGLRVVIPERASSVLVFVCKK